MFVTPAKKKLGRYLPGDRFELPERQARALIAAGVLRAADEIESVEISPRTGLPKRQYQRRDLEAGSI